MASASVPVRELLESNNQRLVGCWESELLRATKLNRARNYHGLRAVQQPDKYQADNEEA
jgi:hypothetical protein